MKLTVAAAIAAMLIAGLAEAQPFERTVPAGRTTTVFTYKPNKACAPATAVATLLVHPQHGRVSHFMKSTTMPTWDRFRGRPTGCAGQAVTGFVITYTPAKGYRGTDEFSLSVDFKETNRQAVDTFRINVQ